MKKLNKFLAFWKKRKKTFSEIIMGIYTNAPAKVIDPKRTPKKIIFPISDYIQAYPYAFEKFGEKFDDPETWDRFFTIDKFGINWLLRQFFAENGFFMGVKRSALVDVVNKKIDKAGFAVVIRKDGNHGDKLYQREGHPMVVAAESIETAFAYVNEILEARENGREPVFTKNITKITNWNNEFEVMNKKALGESEAENKYVRIIGIEEELLNRKQKIIIFEDSFNEDYKDYDL